MIARSLRQECLQEGREIDMYRYALMLEYVPKYNGAYFGLLHAVIHDYSNGVATIVEAQRTHETHMTRQQIDIIIDFQL